MKGVVFIGAHWEELNDKIRVATKFDPGRAQMDMVPRSHWENYPINVSEKLAYRVISLLREHQFHDVEADPTFDWHDDTITPAKWMFPSGTPPATVVSLNARFKPSFHVKIGMALGKLRGEGILIVGSGGAVHNLYRNNWLPMLRSGDNFQQNKKPAQWALDFGSAVMEVIKNNEVSSSAAHGLPSIGFTDTVQQGPSLSGGLIRLTQHPKYKDAHPTDDHYFPLLVAGGAASTAAGHGKLMAQTWELQNMCNSQYVWGSWVESDG